ncbi:carboxymuconolactone decarboxylase family protein [Streptomyces sp. ISL-112]|uniref:carboxymuconolactone decarboxylase family protein n=1 Tax=unclassified Streptomyces TaxID=2593676 RepID=UPI001BED06F9|nr:carboxymuconolactone decarboxylase family protein [Streptomyces sp. ISL-112]MBT2466277.1 carboxymuconolactone decarboxylase family protein [Streptomyces sp. ISL-63]
MRPLVRAVLRNSLRQIRHVKATTPHHAQGLVEQVYRRTERDFGVLAPPVALHSPAAASLAATWMMLRETLLADGLASRAAKETVATEVSRANQCPYCVSVHQAVLETLPPDTTLSPVAEWARTAGLHSPQSPTLSTAPLPFTDAQTPELCGVVVTFHYINRMVTLFLADSPMPARTPTPLRGPIMHTTALAMRPTTPGPLTPGDSLTLLPPAPLPPELAWAQDNPPIAKALARAYAAVDHGARWVPEPVRERLRSRLDRWDATAPGPGRGWLVEAVSALQPKDVPAARLALLTAFAPWQTLPEDVAAFRNRFPTDRELIELTSYAALTTAVRIGSRIPLPRPSRATKPAGKPQRTGY